MIDFTVLSQFEKPVAIHCPKEEQANALLRAMKDQYPDLVSGWLGFYTHWSWDKAETCYAPHIYDKNAPGMQFSQVNYWIGAGYEIVPFEILTQVSDFGEFIVDETADLTVLGIL